MNLGLKNYTKQLTHEIGVCSTHLNLNSKDNNLHISLPLISSIGPSPITLSLIYNYQDQQEDSFFGKGFKLNLYSKITQYKDYFEVKNADGSIDIYTKNERNEFINKETNLQVNCIYEDDYFMRFYYLIKDKYNTCKRFSEEKNYPYFIETKANNQYNLFLDSDNKYIKNNYDDIIRFKLENNKITKITYYQQDKEMYSTIIEYLNGFISKIKYYDGTIISFDFKNDYIIVLDELTNYRIKYNILNNKIISFIDGYDNNFTHSHLTNLIYDNNKTTILNYKNEKNIIFFKDHFPLFEVDNENNVIKNEYDNITKSLISSNIVLSKSNNLFENISLESFTKNNVIFTKENIEDDFFKNLINDSAYKITGKNLLNQKISYTLNLEGMAQDNISVSFYVKQLLDHSSKNYVTVTLSCAGYITKTITKENYNDLFDLVFLNFKTNSTYRSITLTFYVYGEASVILGGIKVNKQELGSFYEYDENNNPILSNNNGNTSNLSYNTNNLPSLSINSNASIYQYEYDEFNNLKKIKTSYATNIENIYDEKNNLLQSTITNKDNSKILQTKKTYSSDGKYLTSIEDELQNKSKFLEYNQFGSILKALDALEVETNFQYNSQNDLLKTTIKKLSESTSISYSYDDHKRIKNINLDNGSVYEFKYDLFNNINEILLNNVTIYLFEYDLETNRLIKQSYGKNCDGYKFKYNDKDLIEEVIYFNKSEEKTVFKYIYNQDNLLLKVVDNNNNVYKEYSYNENNELVSITSKNGKVSVNYDNLKNINFKAQECQNKKIYQTFDCVNRSKGAHPDSLIETYKNDQLFIANFIQDASLRWNNYLLKAIKHDGSEAVPYLTKQGIVDCALINKNKAFSYYLSMNSLYNDECGCLMFWFRPQSFSTTSKRYLFSCKSSKGSDFIGVYILNKKVHLEVKNDTLNKELLVSDYDITTKWNFFALNFINRCDGQGYDDVCEYNLNINGHMQTFIQKNPRLYVDIGPNPLYNIGHNFENNQVTSPFLGRIAYLAIYPRKYTTLDEILRYYRLSKDYIFDNELIENDLSTVDFSQTSLFDIDDPTMEVYPLQNSVLSLNNKKPYEFQIRRTSDYDKDRIFNFNKINKKYSYIADGEKLFYDLGFTFNGTILFKAFTDIQETKQYLFELKDQKNHTLGLYRGDNDFIYIDFNGYKVKTTLTFTSNKWHDVGVSFETYLLNDSEFDIGDKIIRVCIDGSVYIFAENHQFEYEGNLLLSIGRKFESETIANSLSLLNTPYPLYGQIEMLITKSSCLDEDYIRKLFEDLQLFSKIHEYDTLGMLRKEDLHIEGNSILSHTYEYKTQEDTKYISKNISKETINLKRTTFERNYEFDALGRITKIIDDTLGYWDYKYDYRGYLIDAGDKFEYDANGNITKIGDIVLKYDSIIKDRLISINNNQVKYENNNPLLPTTWKQFKLSYEGKRITSIQTPDNEIHYVYDDEGKRIYKLEEKNSTSSRYLYDTNNNLVTEINTNYRLDFLYDENNKLYGFIKDNKDKFFYVRDILQNIIGIINKNGTFVVKYLCNAYGKMCDITGLEASTIGIINPFRYKGYYYDEETKLYYLTSRYYDPEVGRFITPDSINRLDSKSITGLNLYAYCVNDPVNYSDGSGHMPEWAQWLIGGALVIGSIALTICTAGVGGALASAIGGGFWATIGSGALVGAVVGAASGALMSAGTQIIKNGFEDFSWSEVGKDTLTGCIAGFIAGGLFAGIQYGLSTSKIANSVSGLSKAQTRLNNAFKPLSNIKNLSNMPFSGANIARTVGQVAKNYNNAYSTYILSKVTYDVVNATAKIIYFALENLTSYLIGLMF